MTPAPMLLGLERKAVQSKPNAAGYADGGMPGEVVHQRDEKNVLRGGNRRGKGPGTGSLMPLRNGESFDQEDGGK